MKTDVLILNTAVLDIRSPDFSFADQLSGAGGLAKCPTSEMPDYTQEQLKRYVDAGCASAGGPGNTAPLQARAGIDVAVGVNLGAGAYGGLDVQGRFFHDTLTANGVDMSATMVHPTLPTGSTFIHEVPEGERGGIVYFPNANNDFDFDAFKPHLLRLTPQVMYYMYSGLSERGDANEGRDLAQFVAWSRAQGCITIVDSHTLTGNPQELIAKRVPVAGYELLEPLLPELDIFFTSLDEARMIRNTLDTGHHSQATDKGAIALDFLNFVAQRYAADTDRPRLLGVTVKNGAYIHYILPGNRPSSAYFCASRFMLGDVVDLVGAGDSFRAGVTAYVARHAQAFRDGSMNVQHAVQSGNLMATLYVTAPMEARYSMIPRFERMLDVVECDQEFNTLEEVVAALEE